MILGQALLLTLGNVTNAVSWSHGTWRCLVKTDIREAIMINRTGLAPKKWAGTLYREKLLWRPTLETNFQHCVAVGHT